MFFGGGVFPPEILLISFFFGNTKQHLVNCLGILAKEHKRLLLPVETQLSICK